MSKLTLRYKFDASFFDASLTRDDFGYLSIDVETDRISAKGGFWVQWQDVKEFGEALGRYPIGEDQPVVAQWGFEMQEGEDLKLRLEVATDDRRGNLSVRFEVADDDKPEDRARGRFLTNYPDVDAFRLEIARLMRNEVEEAVLNGR
ncbi:hypothetical protein EDF57_102489 [Novosphingobium sp. PhB55]|uniref:hypothetical protein n=1 Tax=Novosphingobium sp. PhB55 TaxID=2485106 RepID=UPI001065F4E3|nr:hypothetical protein [Novosphingobium sp. PhB55]TDW67603.1 hypothetical protein EDF57_102489 [Novosphingobium sp. PhB55]